MCEDAVDDAEAANDEQGEQEARDIQHEALWSGVDTRYAQPLVTVCVAKEWYRFPSSYFLGERHRLAFLPSSFGGHLPRQFQSLTANQSVSIGTSAQRTSFNDANAHEPQHVLRQIEKCSYIVDLVLSGEREPYSDLLIPIDDANFNSSDATSAAPQQCHTWRTIAVESFLDQQNTPALMRAFYLPQELWSAVHRAQEWMTRRLPQLKRFLPSKGTPQQPQFIQYELLQRTWTNCDEPESEINEPQDEEINQLSESSESQHQAQ